MDVGSGDSSGEAPRLLLMTDSPPGLGATSSDPGFMAEKVPPSKDTENPLNYRTNKGALLVSAFNLVVDLGNAKARPAACPPWIQDQDLALST